MTCEQLKAKFPNCSASFIAANCERRSAGQEKLKDDNSAQGQAPNDADNQAGLSEANRADGSGDSRAAYRVTFAFRFPDFRRRDTISGEETLLDLLVAVRRQLDGDTAAVKQRGVGQGKPRLRNHDRKD